MKFVRSIVYFGLFALVFSTDAMAATNWSRVAQAIELSDRQMEALKAAEAEMLRALSRVETSYHAHEITGRQARRLSQAARRSYEETWQRVLTDAQRRRWRQLHATTAQTDRPRQPALWRRIAEVVDLTRQQVGQLEEAEAAYHKRLRRIENAAKEGGMTPRVASGHIRDARGTLRDAIAEILSRRQVLRLIEAAALDLRLEPGDAVTISRLDTDAADNTAVLRTSWGAIKKAVR